MSNLLVNTRDRHFVLFEQLGIEKLFESEPFKDFTKEDLLMIMNEAEKLAVNVIAPTLKESDEEGCHLKDGKVSVPKCYREPYKFCKGGWINPWIRQTSAARAFPLRSALPTWAFGAACYAFTIIPASPTARRASSTPMAPREQQQKYMVKLFSGEWAGTMYPDGAGRGLGCQP